MPELEALGQSAVGPVPDRARVGSRWFAIVYLAHDLRHDRPVALKVLHDEVAASLGAERFEREIKLAARLQHPHIVGVFDSGEIDGRLWFAMPFIEGESLRNRLEREQPTSDRRRDRHRARSRRRARLRAPARRHPPRHQAGQHSAQRPPRAGRRFRHRARARRDRGAERTDGHRDEHRHAGLHESRAGQRRAPARRAQRHLRTRLRACTRCSPASRRSRVRMRRP